MDPLTPEECSIDAAILHILDHQETGLFLADVSLPVNANFQRFVTRHISLSLSESSVAAFEDPVAGRVAQSCDAVFADQQQFLAQSQSLGQQLWDSIKASTHRHLILPGSLLVTRFSNTTTQEAGIALLKLDHTPAFVWRTSHDGGVKRVTVEVNPHALPGGKDKLDKAAFICHPHHRNGYDLRILDKKRTGDDVAGFFKSFLQCRPVQEDRQKTKIFAKQVEQWIRDNEASLPATLSPQALRDYKRNYIANNDEIVVQDFVRSAIGANHPSVAAALTQHLRNNGLLDPTFVVDRSVTEVRRTVFEFRRGTSKVRLSGTAGAMAEMVEPPSREGDSYVIRIRAEEYLEP